MNKRGLDTRAFSFSIILFDSRLRLSISFPASIHHFPDFQNHFSTKERSIRPLFCAPIFVLNSHIRSPYTVYGTISVKDDLQKSDWSFRINCSCLVADCICSFRMSKAITKKESSYEKEYYSKSHCVVQD